MYWHRLIRRVLVSMLSVVSLVCGAADDPRELICRTNLMLIYDGIQHYRSEYKDVPQWLSHLHPRFIADREVLQCPMAKAAGRTSIDVTGRRKLHDPDTSYFYEFNPGEIESTRGHSNREWKFAQMRVVGPVVPIVRCLLHRESLKHADGVLNLAFNGVIYESGLYWENNFTEIVSPDLLTSDHLLAQDTSIRLVVVPPRPELATPQQIDLSKFYNVSLQKPAWIERDLIDLSGVPAGLAHWNGVRFDVRGAVQMASKHTAVGVFPSGTANIGVGQPCRSIHFVHGAIGVATVGTVLGKYLVRYEGGLSREVPIVYGRNVASVHEPFYSAGLAEAKVAFEEEDCPTPVMLWHFTWTNPEPDLVISYIRAVSSVTNAGPILVAVTLEP